ncbi:MAG: hypothetical protein N4A33_04970 [Bacteriovoracaceae bacterium]|jgi:hypothetical protein|nr:hypothetical protein [Bacteriovoracaceae bacterium]
MPRIKANYANRRKSQVKLSSFLCALCGVSRSMKYSKNLSRLNYLQILVLSAVTIYSFWAIIGPKVIFSLFVYWIGFEVINKVLYRKEIPCPHCGFDATWYKRDVTIAKQKVEQFWSLQSPENLGTKTDEVSHEQSHLN